MEIGIYIDAYLARTVKPRRPYIEQEPDGYQESDLDYMRNNAALATALLDAAAALFPVQPNQPKGHMKNTTNLHTLLRSPAGVAALAYVQGTSDEQSYVLRGAGIEPFGKTEAIAVRSDLGTGAADQRGTRELYVRLGETAAILTRFAQTLLEIADAGCVATEDTCRPTP